MSKVFVINACTDFGVNVSGANLGPEIISKNVLNNICTLKGTGSKGQINDGKIKNLNEVNEFNSKLYCKTKEVIGKGFLPITIGGDHSIAIASALASISNNKNMGIIWFDAHGDFNTLETTITGNIHGVPLAAIVGVEKGRVTNFHSGNFYACKNTVIVGGRDIDPLEKENIKKAGVTVFTTNDIKRRGVKEVCEEAFKIAEKGTNGIHISYDIDLIDPRLAPGVSVPAQEGINLEEAYQIVDEILKHKERIKSVDIVEFNPLKDKDRATEKIATEIFKKTYDGFEN